MLVRQIENAATFLTSVLLDSKVVLKDFSEKHFWSKEEKEI